MVYGTPNSGSAGLWYDSVSGSATPSNQRCGIFTKLTTITSATVTVDTSIFSYSTTTTDSVLTVTPTNAAQADTYTVLIQYCLTSYPSKCGSQSTIVTITAAPCVITGSSPPDSSVTVFDALTSYSTFTAFTASASCNTITYTASESPALGVAALTSFSYGSLDF